MYLQQAAILNPNSAITHYDLGYVYESLGDYKNAANEMQAAIGLAPQHVFTRIDLASIYYRNSDLKSAIDILSNIKIDDPLQAQILDAARLTYMAQQNHDIDDQAIAALKQIDINKLSPAYKESLVAIYALEQRDQAVNLLKNACASAPETCDDLAINPSYQNIRNDPEFKELLKKYNQKK